MRGLNDSATGGVVSALISKLSISLIGLLETKVQDSMEDEVRSNLMYCWTLYPRARLHGNGKPKWKLDGEKQGGSGGRRRARLFVPRTFPSFWVSFSISGRFRH